MVAVGDEDLLTSVNRSPSGNGMNSLDAITPDVTFSTAHSNGGLAMFYTVFIVWGKLQLHCRGRTVLGNGCRRPAVVSS